MAAAAILTPTDFLPSHLYPSVDRYGSSFKDSPVARASRPPSYGYDRPSPRDSRRDPGKEREHMRYEPYPVDRRAPGREDERIVLPPPGLGPVRHHQDPYAPRHVLPPVRPQSPASWEAQDPSARRMSQSQVQLPSLRAISGDPAAVRIPGHSSSAYHGRPAPSPREPYRPAPSPHDYHRSAPPYPQPLPSPQYPYQQQSHRVHPYPYPHQPLPSSRISHPPISDRRSPPLRVKHEPDSSPPLRAVPISSRSSDPARHYPAPSRYSPSARPGSSTRRGSLGSPPDDAGDGKEHVVGQTRRLAHLMSEQKRRESINTGFTALRSVLPAALPTDSKAVILRKALARIQQLERVAGIVPAPGQMIPDLDPMDIMSTPSSSRPDWRTHNLRPAPPDDRMMSYTSRSSSSSQLPMPDRHYRLDSREEERYRERERERDRERWARDQGHRTPYEVEVASPERAVEVDVEPEAYPETEEADEIEASESKRHWVGDDDIDRESVYSHERGSSRGSSEVEV